MTRSIKRTHAIENTFYSGVVDAFDQLLELPRLIHVDANVAAADELAVDVQLRNGWPVGVLFDAYIYIYIYIHTYIHIYIHTYMHA